MGGGERRKVATRPPSAPPQRNLPLHHQPGAHPHIQQAPALVGGRPLRRLLQLSHQPLAVEDGGVEHKGHAPSVQRLPAEGPHVGAVCGRGWVGGWAGRCHEGGVGRTSQGKGEVPPDACMRGAALPPLPRLLPAATPVPSPPQPLCCLPLPAVQPADNPSRNPPPPPPPPPYSCVPCTCEVELARDERGPGDVPLQNELGVEHRQLAGALRGGGRRWQHLGEAYGHLQGSTQHTQVGGRAATACKQGGRRLGRQERAPAAAPGTPARRGSGPAAVSPPPPVPASSTLGSICPNCRGAVGRAPSRPRPPGWDQGVTGNRPTAADCEHHPRGPRRGPLHPGWRAVTGSAMRPASPADRLSSGTTLASRHTAPATTGDATLVPLSERQPPPMRLPCREGRRGEVQQHGSGSQLSVQRDSVHRLNAIQHSRALPQRSSVHHIHTTSAPHRSKQHDSQCIHARNTEAATCAARVRARREHTCTSRPYAMTSGLLRP